MLELPVSAWPDWKQWEPIGGRLDSKRSQPTIKRQRCAPHR
jgi:hypothetical protein